MPWAEAYKDIEKERKRRSVYMKKYVQSSAYAESQRKYRSSEKGKAAARRQMRASQIRRYTLTCAKYEEMLQAQGNTCAICKKAQIKGFSLAVDHSHTTNKIRALLCNKCNMALGAVGDSTDILSAMITYLKRFEE